MLVNTDCQSVLAILLVLAPVHRKLSACCFPSVLTVTSPVPNARTKTMSLSIRSLLYGIFCTIAVSPLHSGALHDPMILPTDPHLPTTHLFYQGIVLSRAFSARNALIAENAAQNNHVPTHWNAHGPTEPPPIKNPNGTLLVPRENATLVTLARNSDLWPLARSVRSVEDRFNRRFGYDWVFLNDEAFTSEFREVISSLVSGRAFFGRVPREHWSYPAWIDRSKAAGAREQAVRGGVMHGGSESYRHMCRFFSGFFFDHPLLSPYKYYWRVEPETEYFCEAREDPFRVLRERGAKYGFNVALRELDDTVPGLWESVKGFVKERPELLAEDNLLAFASEDGGASYSGCHFVSLIPYAPGHRPATRSRPSLPTIVL